MLPDDENDAVNAFQFSFSSNATSLAGAGQPGATPTTQLSHRGVVAARAGTGGTNSALSVRGHPNKVATASNKTLALQGIKKKVKEAS